MAIFSFANQYIPDPTRDTALAGGVLYLGFPDTDPELAGNQFPISAIQEDGTVVQIPQPVQINQGGVIVYNGSPVQITFTQNSYSTKVNKNGSQFYYIARTTVSEGLSISEWNTETEYFSGISIVKGSDGKGYYATDDSGPSSAPVDPVTDTDNSHWILVAIITPVGEGDDEIPTNSMIKGNFIVGQGGKFFTDTAPDGWFARDGSTVTNGVVLYPELAAKVPELNGVVTISGNDLIIEDHTDFDRAKGSSVRSVGEFQDDAIRNIQGEFSLSSVAGVFPDSDFSGPFSAGASYGSRPDGVSGSSVGVKFDASLAVPTASENRPKSLTYLSCIYHGVFA